MPRARDTSGVDWNVYFYSDPSSPSGLRWKVQRRKYDIGDVAGNLVRTRNSRTLYWVVSVLDTGHLVHRILWELHRGPLDVDDKIDHLNGDGSNNALSNLERKTHRANCQNKRRQLDNTSGEVGVYLNKKKGRNGEPMDYWMASWTDENLTQRTRCFNISKIGYDEAFKLAVAARTAAITRLNKLNGSYTERHGEVDE